MKNKKEYVFISIFAIMICIFSVSVKASTSFEEQLSDIKTRATGWYTSSGSILIDENYDGDKITMLENGVDVEYDKGIWIHADGLITFTNIQDYGYETFEGYVGVDKMARELSSQATSFVFEFIIDGEIVHTTKQFSNTSEQEFVSIDVSEASVFQIKVDSLGSNSQDYAVMGDCRFLKQEASPYLYVFDLEFNQSNQVTKSNILDYAIAKDYNGNDISGNITYETDFEEGDVGEFDVTYSVVDDEGNKRERTVKIIVTDEDYSKELSVQRMKEPWADYMYHPRQTMDSQNQIAFDYILESVLDFKTEQGTYVTNKPNEAYKFTINLLDNGIYVNSYYIKNMTSILYDSEPRVYLIRKWTQEYTSKNGLVDTITFYMTYNYLNEENEYDDTTQLILENGNRFLAEAKDDMTYQQKFYYTVNAYAKWIVYSDGGELIHSMAYGYGKCGGNAMGVVHLGHRLNIKSNYGDGNVGSVGFHGWSYQKMPEEDGWYFTDTLWGRMLNSPNDDTYAPYRGDGIYTWFDENETTYSADKKKYTYPSVWIELESEVISLVKGEEYDFYSNISNVDSIFDDNIELSDVQISVRYKDETLNTYINTANSISVMNISNIPEGNCLNNFLEAGDNLLRGSFIVTYTADYMGFYIQEEAELIVTDTKVEDNEYVAMTGTVNTNIGVYDGENEHYGKGFSLNNSSYVTLDVEDKNYKTINFKYSAKDYVRTDSYCIAYAKMYLNVYFDGVLAYTSPTMTAYSTYVSPTLIIPEGTKEIKLANIQLGQGSHGGINDIYFGYSEDDSDETIPHGNAEWVITKEPTYEEEGERQLIGECGCVFEIEVIEKLGLSSNAKIANLKIIGYEINPSFDSDIYEYTLNVLDIESLEFVVELEDSTAKYTISGNEDFKQGENVIKINVIAEDGTEKTYSIVVMKEETEVEQEEDNKEPDEEVEQEEENKELDEETEQEETEQEEENEEPDEEVEQDEEDGAENNLPNTGSNKYILISTVGCLSIVATVCGFKFFKNK